MAITIKEQPEQYTPAGNPIRWQISSDNFHIVSYRLEVRKQSNNALINSMELMLIPTLTRGTFVDLSTILSNLVTWEVNNNSAELVAPITDSVAKYKLKFIERQLSGNTLVDGASLEVTDQYVWNAVFDRLQFKDHKMVKYALDDTNVISFLTNKPNYSVVNGASTEHLYFISNFKSPLTVRIRTYDSTGSLLDTVQQAVLHATTNNMYRINVSPKSLVDSVGLNLSDVNHYVVDVLQSTTVRSEERIYTIQELDCSQTPVNILWINSQGGLDSYQFVNPVDVANINRSTIKKNTYKVDRTGIYTDYSNGIFNPSEVVINTETKPSTKVTSRELRDAEAYWLLELFNSKQVFTEQSDGSLIPIKLETTSYQIPKLKQRRGELNTIDFTFEMAAGIVPRAIGGLGNTQEKEFIEEQMNSLVTNTSGYNAELD